MRMNGGILYLGLLSLILVADRVNCHTQRHVKSVLQDKPKVNGPCQKADNSSQSTKPKESKPCKTRETECKKVELERIGCFDVDSHRRPRPLPELLFTDLDKTSPVYSGFTIDPDDTDSHMISLICRCAFHALYLGYETIGLQHYGECWSGKDSEIDYARDGASDFCITWGKSRCRDGVDCIGEDSTNFVYKVYRAGQLPTGKPTTRVPSLLSAPTPAFPPLWPIPSTSPLGTASSTMRTTGTPTAGQSPTGKPTTRAPTLPSAPTSAFPPLWPKPTTKRTNRPLIISSTTPSGMASSTRRTTGIPTAGQSPTGKPTTRVPTLPSAPTSAFPPLWPKPTKKRTNRPGSIISSTTPSGMASSTRKTTGIPTAGQSPTGKPTTRAPTLPSAPTSAFPPLWPKPTRKRTNRPLIISSTTPSGMASSTRRTTGIPTAGQLPTGKPTTRAPSLPFAPTSAFPTSWTMATRKRTNRPLMISSTTPSGMASFKRISTTKKPANALTISSTTGPTGVSKGLLTTGSPTSVSKSLSTTGRPTSISKTANSLSTTGSPTSVSKSLSTTGSPTGVSKGLLTTGSPTSISKTANSLSTTGSPTSVSKSLSTTGSPTNVSKSSSTARSLGYFSTTGKPTYAITKPLATGRPTTSALSTRTSTTSKLAKVTMPSFLQPSPTPSRSLSNTTRSLRVPTKSARGCYYTCSQYYPCPPCPTSAPAPPIAGNYPLINSEFCSQAWCQVNCAQKCTHACCQMFSTKKPKSKKILTKQQEKFRSLTAIKELTLKAKKIIAETLQLLKKKKSH